MDYDRKGGKWRVGGGGLLKVPIPHKGLNNTILIGSAYYRGVPPTGPSRARGGPEYLFRFIPASVQQNEH